jgi:hypothetical protein
LLARCFSGRRSSIWPSGRTTSSLIETSIDAWFRYRSVDRRTPIPTAAWIGSASVATNVATIATREIGPVRQMTRNSSTLIVLTPATISSPARAGMGTASTSGPSATRITSMNTPDRIAAHRALAPPLTLSAVRPTDAPTGMPLNSPKAAFAAPWAMKSLFG